MMDRKVGCRALIAVLLATLLAGAAPAPAPHKASGPVSISVRFSPKGGITEAVVAAIDRAKKEVLVHSYSFTSEPICTALVAAKKRGVDVRMVIDGPAAKSKFCRAHELLKAQCQVRIATCRGIAHNKVMLIDGQTVITGSFNWSNQAEKLNQENQLIITGYPDIMAAYQENWQQCWEAGTPYSQR